MSPHRATMDGESLITPQMFAERDAAAAARAETEALQTAKVQIALLLRTVQKRIENAKDAGAATMLLNTELDKLRSSVSQDVWRSLIPIAQDHPINAFLQQDPFTAWSCDKPRGYSGDAGLIDIIYHHPCQDELVASATPLGRAIYEVSANATAAVAARERRDILARHVDRIAAERGADAEVLAVAAGHLREAELSTALKEGRLKRWVALDQDPISIGSVTRDYAGTAVEAVNGSVKGLLGSSYNLGTFDLVYAAGLYDYLPRAVAVRLTRKCLRLLKPGGMFLFANYHVSLPDEAYMEAFMNWELILRSQEEMWDIVNASADRNEVEAKVESGVHGALLYATMTKRP